jgi:hypothetical protein
MCLVLARTVVPRPHQRLSFSGVIMDGKALEVITLQHFKGNAISKNLQRKEQLAVIALEG